MSTDLPSPLSEWSPARRVAAGVFAAVAFATLFAAALYASAVLFLLANQANPAQARLLSAVHYWRLYANDPPLRNKLIGSVLASGVGLLVVLPCAMVAAARPRRPLHGDARFASPAEVRQAGLLDGGQASTPGILLGRYRGQFLALSNQLSVMLSAPTRSGKGTSVVVPNLLNWPHSTVVLDVKGENYRLTAGYRAQHGQAVFAFSPFDDDARSHRWNPLSAVRSHPLHRVGDLLSIAQVLFPNEGTHSASEAFFNDQARNLFLGLGLLLLETPELPRTLGEILRQASGKGQALKSHLATLIASRDELERPYSDECKNALQRLLSNSENTLSSIVATLNAPLVIFADPIVDAATSGDDFCLDALRREPLSIYVRIPPNRLASARPLMNLFVSQLVHLNTQRLPEQDPTLKLQCLLINDEFAALGRVGILASAAAFLAGYNLRLLTVVQAMSQLDALYGEKEARTFATNHGLQILFAPREQRDADEYSAMLGQFTERGLSRGRSRSFSQPGHSSVSQNESEQRRPLLLPQEFKALGSERVVLVLENCKPILAQKIRYHRDKVFKARLMAAPVVPVMDMAVHRARISPRWRYLAEDPPGGTSLGVESVAVESPGAEADALPDAAASAAMTAHELARVYLDCFEATPGDDARRAGGEIAPAPDEDGVLMDSGWTRSPGRAA